ncbi:MULTISPECIES: hypothetical protein [unclassified Variovorax]|jgi:hypothetical protein|uniref:hypothetical protein n=1 Tax=unclassified Variovorax TaxID=663243 RepID=UPI00076D2B36|nr:MULTISPECIES: hypothetical protein [unclassified Variovorax]KWT85245.1 hypothetical protein APY03_4048 [Variovorax sp. WDL1]PNG56679.1 hypothetical protein CHC07_03101 [Variovorax sp. B4]PNG58103.1 hypothetical protein CHC06_03104 [Variovorax sp. B2]VTV09404.1 hypothetical protein WDL1CHR_00521 [Variovorax sp. WDL1]
MKNILSFFALAATVLSAAFATTDAEAATRRAVWSNAAGGVTANTMTGRLGPYGGGVLRGRSVSTDALGNATAASHGVVRGRNGGFGQRSGSTMRNADGSASHQSAFSGSSARGSISSSGGATRDAMGNVSQSRGTTATNAVTGNSIQATRSYNSATGATRTATCYNASGAVISCR